MNIRILPKCAAPIACLLAMLSMANATRLAAQVGDTENRLLLFVGSNTLGEHAIPEVARSYLERVKGATTARILPPRGEVIFVAARLNDRPVYIEIHATGSGDCFKSFLGAYPADPHPCDIGMSSRKIKANEAERLQSKYAEDFRDESSSPEDTGNEHAIAMDGVAIVVDKANPLQRISFNELKGIYSGIFATWDQLADWKISGSGAKASPIYPYRRKAPSGTLDFFNENIQPALGPGTAMQDETRIPAFVNSDELAQKVALTPGGIGFVGQSFALDPGLHRLQVYKEPGMKAQEAVFPDLRPVREESYPLSRKVYLYTRKFPANPEVKSFLRYVMSEEGQNILADRGGLVKFKSEEDLRKPAPPIIMHSDLLKNVVLRMHGSNTIGAECAVDLAYLYFFVKGNGVRNIREEVQDIITPEGEKARLTHVLCDLSGEGVWQTIEILPTGSSDAFARLETGACDLGMASRPITTTEADRLNTTCGPLTAFPLGRDALSFIVYQDNPITQITIGQIRRCYLGEIKNWKELGGPDLPIKLYARPNISGTYKHFVDHILQGRLVSPETVRCPENCDIITAVTGDKGALGFVPMAKTSGLRVLKVAYEGSSNYILPTEDTVRLGRYPAALCRYLYLYVPVRLPWSTSDLARRNWRTAVEFANLTQSWLGQDIVHAGGFTTDLPGHSSKKPSEDTVTFLRRVSEFPSAAPASGEATFLTFQPDGTTLTAESKNIVDRQIGPLFQRFPELRSAHWVAEGWSDNVGTDAECIATSRQRAEIAAGYLREQVQMKIDPIGKGRSLDTPNTDEETKRFNRRVVIKVQNVAAETTQLKGVKR